MSASGLLSKVSNTEPKFADTGTWYYLRHNSRLTRSVAPTCGDWMRHAWRSVLPPRVLCVMRNAQRDDGPGVLHHVTARVNWRAWLLDDDQVKRYLARLIREAAEQFGIDVLAAVLMSNHIHLVVRSPEGALYAHLTSRRTSNRHSRAWPRGHQKSTVIAQFMRSIRHRVSLRLHHETGLSGRFWEGRYDARPIEDARSLSIRMAYDHRNPVKANMVDRPEDYTWSTEATWLTEVEGPLPVLLRKPLPFGLTRERLRSEVLRYQGDERLDEMDEGLRELFSRPGPVSDDDWRKLFDKYGADF